MKCAKTRNRRKVIYVRYSDFIGFKTFTVIKRIVLVFPAIDALNNRAVLARKIVNPVTFLLHVVSIEWRILNIARLLLITYTGAQVNANVLSNHTYCVTKHNWHVRDNDPYLRIYIYYLEEYDVHIKSNFEFSPQQSKWFTIYKRDVQMIIIK